MKGTRDESYLQTSCLPSAGSKDGKRLCVWGVWGRRKKGKKAARKMTKIRRCSVNVSPPHAHKQSPFCREAGNKENIYKREGTKIDGAIIEVILFPRLLCVGETFRKQATVVNDAVIGDTRWTSWSQYLDSVACQSCCGFHIPKTFLANFTF